MNNFVLENECYEQVKIALSSAAKKGLGLVGAAAAGGGAYLGFRKEGPLRKVLDEDRQRTQYFQEKILPGMIEAENNEEAYQAWKKQRGAK